MNAENDETRKAQGAERTSVGTQLSGIYELDERIASGGMGEVFRGHNIQTGDHVAIKIVLPEFARDQTILSLFRKEASILNHLSHDAVVRYHVFTVDPGIGRPYLAMEFVNGQSLFDVLLRGPLSPADVRKLCHRLASGLSAVHEAGAVHRDLSPDNVILPGGRVDRAKIIDFGIARLATVGGETLIGGKFAGKYNYVSPEQLGLYGGEVSERSDIYSLGLVLAAALRGRPIDMGGSQLEVVDKRRCVPDLSDIDGDLRPIIEMMLQPDPADRLGSMAEIADMTRTVVPQDLDQTLVSKSATMRGRPGGLPQAAQLALAHSVADEPPTKNGQGQVGAASPAKPEVRRLVARKRPAHLSNPRSSAAVTADKTPRAPQAKHSMGGRTVTILSLLTLVVAAGAGAYLGGFIPPLAQLAGSSKSETAPFKPDLSKVSQSEGTPAIDQPVKATPQPSTPTGPEGSSTKAPSTNQMAAKTDQNTAAVQGPPKAPVPQSVAAKTPSVSADQSIATSNKDHQPPPAQNNQAQNLQTPGAALVPATTQPGSTAAATKTPPVSADQSVATSNKDHQPPPAQNTQAQNLQTPGAALVPATTQPGSTAAATKTPPVSADQSIATSNMDRQPAPAQNNQAQNLQTPGAALVPTTIQPGPTAGPGGGKPAADKVKEDTVALNVPPTQTPAVLGVDEAGERIAWLRAYNGGDCFYAAVTSSTDKVANIEGFGTAEAPFDAVRQAFQAKFHIQADISPQIIAPGQCGVVSFLRSLGGTPAHAPKLVLDRTSVLSGAPISGSLETNGGLLSHLFLIDHKGTAFNLDARITVQFGKANFSIPIGLGAADRAAGKALPQILLVITGPDSIQSANFTTPMPASAVLAKILAEIRVKGSTFSATAKYFRLGE